MSKSETSKEDSLEQASKTERQVRFRDHFTANHWHAANLFAVKATRLENEPPTKITDGFLIEHRSFVVGAVLTSAAMIESNINDLFVEAAEKRAAAFPTLPEYFQDLMAELWDEMEKAPALKKYQMALVCAGKEQFDKGGRGFQSADNLFAVRNRLVHFKPEWNDEPGEHLKLERRLRGAFAENPFVASTEPFFPYRCLGAGCAGWSVTVATEFVQAFRKQIGLQGGLRMRSMRVR
jgi:hypothetical protein